MSGEIDVPCQSAYPTGITPAASEYVKTGLPGVAWVRVNEELPGLTTWW